MKRTRLAALFVTALAGVLVILGLALAPLGAAVESAYLLVVAVGLVLVVRQARRLRATQDEGRTCSCCTTTVFDPIEVR